MTSTSHWTVADVICRIHGRDRDHFESSGIEPAPRPEFRPNQNAEAKLFFGVDSLRHHMTDEGWQLQCGLQQAGYTLTGPGLDVNIDDVESAVSLASPCRTAIIQDRREWDCDHFPCFDRKANFKGMCCLADKPDIFKVTILKDAQHDVPLGRKTADEFGIHAWIHYYHPDIVATLSPFVRREHLIRTWHTVDREKVPWKPDNRRRRGALLSGATLGLYYPLRLRIKRNLPHLPLVDCLEHPGYGTIGSRTPQFLQTLANYRVAICTASVYGYVLRKIIEATACGCVVITDLPSDEIIPGIDDNLVRVRPDIGIGELRSVIEQAHDTYDSERQEEFAGIAMDRFDYRHECRRLAESIEEMRAGYGS